MAKIADIEAHAGTPKAHVIAEGKGWSVHEVLCNSGPKDRPFEEQHANYSVSLVLGGTFQYRSTHGRELMSPGSVLLGNAGHNFECSHEHGVGDHCLSFQYSREYFATLAGSPGDSNRLFRLSRLPAMRSLSPVFTRACAAALQSKESDWEDISLQLAANVLDAAQGPWSRIENTAAAEARVTRVLRMIEQSPDATLDLNLLAHEAKLSLYHFLRLFQRLTDVTPHQYILRMRLRKAAMRLTLDGSNIIDIAGDCGFGDVSNFNRAFRAEFGMSPRRHRQSRR